MGLPIVDKHRAYQGKAYHTTQSTPWRLVCLFCKKEGKSILKKESDFICSHCEYDNLNDPSNLMNPEEPSIQD